MSKLFFSITREFEPITSQFGTIGSACSTTVETNVTRDALTCALFNREFRKHLESNPITEPMTWLPDGSQYAEDFMEMLNSQEQRFLEQFLP